MFTSASKLGNSTIYVPLSDGGTTPASTASGHPSPSESVSQKLGMPSPSVSRGTLNLSSPKIPIPLIPGLLPPPTSSYNIVTSETGTFPNLVKTDPKSLFPEAPPPIASAILPIKVVIVVCAGFTIVNEGSPTSEVTVTLSALPEAISISEI